MLQTNISIFLMVFGMIEFTHMIILVIISLTRRTGNIEGSIFSWKYIKRVQNKEVEKSLTIDIVE